MKTESRFSALSCRINRCQSSSCTYNGAPPNASSIASATASARSSRQGAAMTWTPIGKPFEDLPTGTDIDRVPSAKALRQTRPFATMLSNIKNRIEHLNIRHSYVIALTWQTMFDFLKLGFGESLFRSLRVNFISVNTPWQDLNPWMQAGAGVQG